MCSDQPTGRLALVFELMDMNIYELIRGRRHYLAPDFIRTFMFQLLKVRPALPFLHFCADLHARRTSLWRIASNTPNTWPQQHQTMHCPCTWVQPCVCQHNHPHACLRVCSL